MTTAVQQAAQKAALQLTHAQSEVFLHPARFKVVCAGRRFGKTFLALGTVLHKACDPTAKGKVFWYVAPSYRQASQIAWKLLKNLLPFGWAKRTNETDLSIELKNGAIIALRGADNYDSLRGVGLDGLVLDEVQDMSPDAWREVLRPALADRQGWMLAIGTPKGFNHFYELWSGATCREGWKAWQFTTADGGNVPVDELEAARMEMDERTFRQEFEASWEALSGRVFQSFERAIHVRKDLEDIPATPLLVGLDFNINPMSAVIGVKAVDQLHILDEIEIPNGNTEMVAGVIRERFPNRLVNVYPDPSGNARKTSAPVGQTDFTLLRQAGFRVFAPNKAPLVVDRINDMNACFKNSKNEIHFYVHPRCQKLIKALEGLTYKEGTSAPDKTSGLDHITDALGYLISYEFPILRNTGRMIPFRM